MNNIPLNDQQDRERALDPRTSFIVQAPAGSGKTELLTQRFLVLLNQVKSPEEILAITFTKKSAHEMRARIVNTLKKVALSSIPPEQEHALKTWKLARNVLIKDQQFQWNLLSNPNRLRIQTIDSFNSSLTRHLPILSQFGATPEISDESSLLYAEATQEFLSHLEENVAWSDAIAHLLLHMDNDLNRVQTLLINMLAKRDQWLKHLTTRANNIELRDELEASLQHAITDSLSRLTNIFNNEIIQIIPEIKKELLELIQFAFSNLSPHEDIYEFPTEDIHDQETWLVLANFLLTKEHQWRKQVTAKEGFPAPGKDLRLKEFKDRAVSLINQLNTQENLRSAIEELRTLPSQQYADSQWEILQSLHTVLTIAAAQLRLTFQKYGKIDYVENAQAALNALGSDEAPTDIALALDYRIQHILVDEFQDTAQAQYNLIEKLTAGWEKNDGRTLFVVGDPMQSIYRFREAEVGLFIRARKIGLRKIPLEPLTLSVNFRSTAGIVEWVNRSFKIVFPQFEDVATGAVSYSSSVANNTIHDNALNAVTLHSSINTDAYKNQSTKIIDLIHQAKQKNPQGSIAILVRTRTHLKAIIPALKAARLPFRAIKIDPLSLRPVIQDLMALTRALIHPADRIAWLSVLRAPWCGLSLSDLLLLTGKDQNNHLWKQLQSSPVLETLSTDGQARLARILPFLKEKMSERRRQPLRLWIESTWIALGGPACGEQLSDLEDAAAYFKLLERLDSGSDLIHFDVLNETIKQLFAAPDNQADDRLQIMTIHNAKGLEFDTVILPHLEKKPSQDSKQLLLWMERPRFDASSDLIIAPVNAIGDENDSIYNYIKRQQKIKSQYEDGRLLYVAATRAKKHLHLLFSLEHNTTKDIADIKPNANSLLEKLWPAIKDEVLVNISKHESYHSTLNHENNINALAIKRLVMQWKNPIQKLTTSVTSGFHNKTAGFLLPDNKPKVIGKLIHSILQLLANHGLSWWQEKNHQQQDTYITNYLIQSGILNHELDNAIAKVKIGIENIFHDEKALWILQTHTHAQSEFAITSIIDNETVALVLDRTFIDNSGTHWIIDYKTSILSNDDLENFLTTEKKKYEQQLWLYHQAMKNLSPHPIKVALYFPMIPAWKEWTFEELQKEA